MKDGSQFIVERHLIVSLTETSFKNGANDMPRMVNMVNDILSKKQNKTKQKKKNKNKNKKNKKTLQILCSSDHPILFKFYPLMVRT